MIEVTNDVVSNVIRWNMEKQDSMLGVKWDSATRMAGKKPAGMESHLHFLLQRKQDEKGGHRHISWNIECGSTL